MGDKKAVGAEVREDMKKMALIFKKKKTRSIGGNYELHKNRLLCVRCILQSSQVFHAEQLIEIR